LEDVTGNIIVLVICFISIWPNFWRMEKLRICNGSKLY